MTTVRYLIFFLIFLSAQSTFCQSLNGVWRGPLAPPANPSMVVQSTLTLRVAGEKLTGEVIVQANGTADRYTLQGTTDGQQGSGLATYPADGSKFQFEAALQNGKLLFGIGQNGAALMNGVLERSSGISGGSAVGGLPTGSAVARGTKDSPKADGLYRDPALIGAWRTTTNYGGGSTDGGFYGSTSSTMILNPDGTFGDGGSSGYASGADVSVQSSGASGNDSILGRLNAMGARWFTKGNIVYVRVPVNGQIQDLPASKYYVEKGRMLITDLKSGKKMLYTRP